MIFHFKHKIILQLIEGISYLHQMNIIHGDLKPQNVLYDENLNIKITDYGLSKEIPNGKLFTTADGGTPHYQPPEVFLKRQKSYFSDIYSFGLILAELVRLQRTITHYFKIEDVWKNWHLMDEWTCPATINNKMKFSAVEGDQPGDDTFLYVAHRCSIFKSPQNRMSLEDAKHHIEQIHDPHENYFLHKI